jgi:hypothetical protein
LEVSRHVNRQSSEIRAKPLTIKLAESSIFLKAGRGNTHPIVFYRAISTGIIDSDVDLGCTRIQRILKQAEYYAIQRGYDSRGLDLRNNVPGKRLYRHVVCESDISFLGKSLVVLIVVGP